MTVRGAREREETSPPTVRERGRKFMGISEGEEEEAADEINASNSLNHFFAQKKKFIIFLKIP